MRIDFKGRLEDAPEIRAAVVGCGSHSFRNIFPTFQFAPVKLVATCDLDIAKAKAFCEKFGGEGWYASYEQMLEREELDAVFLIVGNDSHGRPMYPQIAADCVSRGVNVWIEKPPAAVCADVELMMEASEKYRKIIMTGYKKIFVQANRKAKELARAPEFGGISMVTLQNPEQIPGAEELSRYINGRENLRGVVLFAEHLCHPISQMVSLLGMPSHMMYTRNSIGAGAVLFEYENDVVAELNLTCGAAMNGGVERTVIISRQGVESGGRIGGKHIVVDNNLRLSYHRNPDFSYGDETDFYKGTADEQTAVWEPEFSRGQMFNKGLFLLGYFDEVNEFARAILEKRQPAEGTLEQAWQATRIFEGFAEGPGRRIALK